MSGSVARLWLVAVSSLLAAAGKEGSRGKFFGQAGRSGSKGVIVEGADRGGSKEILLGLRLFGRGFLLGKEGGIKEGIRRRLCRRGFGGAFLFAVESGEIFLIFGLFFERRVRLIRRRSYRLKIAEGGAALCLGQVGRLLVEEKGIVQRFVLCRAFRQELFQFELFPLQFFPQELFLLELLGTQTLLFLLLAGADILAVGGQRREKDTGVVHRVSGRNLLPRLGFRDRFRLWLGPNGRRSKGAVLDVPGLGAGTGRHRRVCPQCLFDRSVLLGLFGFDFV